MLELRAVVSILRHLLERGAHGELRTKQDPEGVVELLFDVAGDPGAFQPFAIEPVDHGGIADTGRVRGNILNDAGAAEGAVLDDDTRA